MDIKDSEIFQDLSLLKKTESAILNSHSIGGKNEFIRKLSEQYPNSPFKGEIVRILFILTKDEFEQVRLEALRAFTNSVKIPEEILLETISKDTKDDYKISTHSHVGSIDALLTDASPLVRSLALQALAFSFVPDNEVISSELIKTIASIFNDSSTIVRAAAIGALRKCLHLSGKLFYIENSQIKKLVSMLEDSSRANRCESAFLLENLLVEDANHAFVLTRGLAEAASKYPQNRMVYFRSACKFGSNNWYYFHLALHNKSEYFKSHKNFYQMETLVPIITLFAAKRGHNFPIPNFLKPYSKFFENIVLKILDDVKTEVTTDLDQLQRTVNGNMVIGNHLKYESDVNEDSIDYILGLLPKEYFVVENKNGESKINRLTVNIVSPKRNTIVNPYKYTASSTFFSQVKIVLNFHIDKPIYCLISTPSQDILSQLKRDPTDPLVYEYAIKIDLIMSSSEFKTRYAFFIRNEEGVDKEICDPLFVWYRSL